MGFLKNLLSDGYGSGQQYIDNTEHAVTARLEYLRYAPYEDWHGNCFPSNPLPKSVCTQPREIVFQVTSMDYTAMIRVEDSYHYPYSYAQIKALLDSPEYYDERNAASIGGMMLGLSRRIPGLFPLYPVSQERYTVIPMTHETVTDTLKLPDPIHSLFKGMDGYTEQQVMRSLVNQALEDDSWRYATFQYARPPIRSHIGTEQLEPEYVVYMHLNIGIRINGIEADKYNMTYTERAKIAKVLHCGQAFGRFLSDGREHANDIPASIFDRYNARRAESLDFRQWYGMRQIKNAKQRSQTVIVR